jgi:hemin uptake protein HemP
VKADEYETPKTVRTPSASLDRSRRMVTPFRGSAERPVRSLPAVAEPRPGSIRSFDTAQLFAGSTEIELIHEGAVYRLKITRQGKLILNK